MFKKTIIFFLLIVIALSVYTLLSNLYLEWEYRQNVSSMQQSYMIRDSFSMMNPNSPAVPRPLRNYINYSVINLNNLPSYVKLNYSGTYYHNASKTGKDFTAKSFYNIKELNYISEFMIDDNRIIFHKVREKLLESEKTHEKKLLGIINRSNYYSEEPEQFLRTRFIFDAVYFPYFYLSDQQISWNSLDDKSILIRIAKNEKTMEYTMKFNDDYSLSSIVSEEFLFERNRVRFTANYSNYIRQNNFRVPTSMELLYEDSFENFTIFEANLNSLSYQ
ncbi:DUF6544 family protein [Halanaerobium hydrogeniformans]|uniref:Uncharacterized protein n=1 Tax=Halanaerobium hydrogeniformans TaxID=656519 RepID=E4RKV1_HALHG|nr:DUF6544 family protein [Halanaerobium hydrogeniformans]ADQ15692.1 hypothetical protein Halsa_2284 [Halanaerobium hydrogeniformans]